MKKLPRAWLQLIEFYPNFTEVLFTNRADDRR